MSDTPGVPLADDAEALFEQAPCGYLTLGPDGTITRANATFLGWTGFTAGELASRRFRELLSRGGQLYYETHLAPLLALQGAVSEIALELVHRDGSRMPVLVTATLERPADGTPPVIRAAIFDARQRRRYEQELVRLRDVERDARARTERLQEVSAALAAALEPRAIGEAVLRALAPLDRSGESLLVLIDARAGSARVVAWRGAEPDLAVAPVAALPALHPASDSILQACVVDRRTAGILRIRGSRSDLDAADEAFLAAVSEQCALALERARLLAETQAEGERARLLARIVSGLSEVFDSAGRARRLEALLVPELADRATVELPDGTPEHAPVEQAAPLRLVQPLVAGGTLLATLTLERGPERAPFGASDRELVEQIGARATVAFTGARLFDEERNVARALQSSLLAGALPDDPRVTIATYYRAGVRGLQVGGDWYDAFTIEPGRIAVVVGDIVGRGLLAASAMGRLRSAVRAFAVAGHSPGVLLEQLDAFAAIDPPTRMATLVYADIELGDRRVRMASAGHPPALLVEPGAAARYLWEGRSPPVGAFLEPRPRAETSFVPRAGSRLILFTDGLVERRAHPLDVGLGELERAAGARRAQPLADLIPAVVHALLANEPSDDDVCLLGLELRPAA